MLNVNIKFNKSIIKYTDKNNEVITFEYEYHRPLLTEDNNGDYRNLAGSKKYNIYGDGKIYPYECFKKQYNYDKGFYFNTILNLKNIGFDFNDVVFPKYIFYDIETGADSLPIHKISNNGVKWLKAPDTAVINSIAWIDGDNNSYCLIRGRDGSEYDILKEFNHYLKTNNIMSLIGHNNYKFDDILLRDRLKHYRLNNDLFKKGTNQNNLDTLVLARLFQYVPKSKSISLNDLANHPALNIDINKYSLGGDNPISAYEKAVKLKSFTEFETYNIIDVEVCKAVFEAMDSKKILTELFKLTYCPLNKMDSTVHLLNHYTCHKLFNNKIIVPRVVNEKLSIKNNGGYNYIKNTGGINKYDNIVCMDIVSYYPHLFMLIGADNNYKYSNFNTTTGDVNRFNNNLPNGVLSRIASALYTKRATIKQQMKEETDTIKKEQLNHNQKTLKIIVNSLYGACDSNYGYILGSHKISTLITSIGRTILKELIKEFDVVYGKTDSIFVRTTTPQETLYKVNEATTRILKERFNLNNYKADGSNIIRFEIDSVMDSLIVKDKNNYIKIIDGEPHFKGSSFKGDGVCEFETDLLKKYILEENYNLEEIFNYCDYAIKNKPLSYFSKKIKLSKKTPNNSNCLGRQFMDDNILPYNWGFKYNGVRVHHKKYDWILYPNNVNPRLKVSPFYVYMLAINYLYNFKIITLKEKQALYKNKELVRSELL